MADIFESARKLIFKELDEAKKKIVLLVRREAGRNAPKSANMTQLKMHRKTGKKKSKLTKRNPRAFSKAKPGGLERSINGTVEKGEMVIFVEANSEAGKYAERIHDKKFVDWKKRGVGTVLKGIRADEKFIERAIKDNEKKIREQLEKGLERAIKNA